MQYGRGIWRQRTFASLSISLLLLSSGALCDPKSNRIDIAYGSARTTSQISLLETLKRHNALETLQEIFSPLELPAGLTLRTIDCNGAVNAWYYEGSVGVCYEYLERIGRHLPVNDQGPVTRSDAIIGQFFYVFAHEMGHAVFDLLEIPVFGRREDAADQFAAFIMLQFQRSEARRLVLGAAYAYSDVLRDPNLPDPLKAYSDAHSVPAQRFFNLLCIAYGADPALFTDIVDKGYLPKSRAANCRLEYGEVAYAFYKLVRPHIDTRLAKSILQKSWLPADARKPGREQN
jgi:hypothetical protein